MPSRLRFALGLVVLSGILGFVGVRLVGQLGRAHGVANELSCEELVTRGPGDNHHVVLNGCEADGRTAREQSVDGPGYLWVGMRVADGTDDGDTVLLLKYSEEAWASKREPIHAGAYIQGLLLNEIEPLEPHQRNLLARGFSGAPLDHLWVLDVGRRPPSPARAYGTLVVALAALLGGLGVGWVTYGPGARKA